MRCAARDHSRTPGSSRRRASRCSRSASSYASSAIIAATSRSRRVPPSGREPGQEVDGRRRPGQQFVGQGAELEPLGDGVGGRQQLRRAQRLQQRRGGGQHAAVRAEELVRRAGEEVRAERGHVDRRVCGEVHAVHRQQCAGRACTSAAISATGGRVPIRFDAPVTATSLVRSVSTSATSSAVSSPVAGSNPIQRTVAPAASAAITQGRTFASWSSRETTTSSPGPQPAASVRARSKVSWVALRPNTMPRGSAPSRSAIAERAAEHGVVGQPLGGGDPAAVGDRGGQRLGDRAGDRLRHLGPAGAVEVRGA